MKALIVWLIILFTPLAFLPERPTVNLPESARQSNWRGPYGQGSCVHATMISLFRWNGQDQLASYWRDTYGDGERPSDLATKLDRAGVYYAYVTNGDVNFLEWSIRTRRGCGVTVLGGKHMVALVGLDAQYAYVLDNNHTEQILVVPRESFLAEWRASYGWAVTPLFSPAAPLPQ